MPEPFPATRWTLLARAKEQDDSGALARKEFAELYHRPVQAFLFAVVREPTVADDLTQEFFARITKTGGIFRGAQQGKGTFRGYLMQALRHLTTDYHRKRGRDEAKQTHPDQWDDGGWDNMNLPGIRSAEAAFHDAWVEATLKEALAAVRDICHKKGQHLHLELFEARYLSGKDSAPSWEELGALHGLDQKTARTRADTVARHFRFVLRRMLRHQVMVPGNSGSNQAQLSETAIDQEIQALLSPIQD